MASVKKSHMEYLEFKKIAIEDPKRLDFALLDLVQNEKGGSDALSFGVGIEQMKKRREGDGFVIGSDTKDHSLKRYLAALLLLQATTYFKSWIES